MNQLNIKDKIEFHSTGDAALDGQVGIIEGFYGTPGAAELYPIVLFSDVHPAGYNPAIVITPYCVKKV